MVREFEGHLSTIVGGEMVDESSSILADTSVESDIVLIAFSGILGGYGGMPVFEFSRVLSRFAVKKIFIRDVSQAWYQNGLPGVGENVDQIADYLQKRISEANGHRVITLGNSMGGYAALLFGWLLQADEAYAFSPQTFIDVKQRLLRLDFRWQREIRKIHRDGRSTRKYMDLVRVFRSQPRASTECHVYYCSESRLDRCHAKRMGCFPNVVLHAHEAGGHMLVKLLRDIGYLDTLLSQTLQGGVD
jgi:hypothetical protein